MSDFVPFVKERSSMGRLLSLETGKNRRKKNNKVFDLAKESITYLNQDF